MSTQTLEQQKASVEFVDKASGEVKTRNAAIPPAFVLAAEFLVDLRWGVMHSPEMFADDTLVEMAYELKVFQKELGETISILNMAMNDHATNRRLPHSDIDAVRNMKLLGHKPDIMRQLFELDGADAVSPAEAEAEFGYTPPGTKTITLDIEESWNGNGAKKLKSFGGYREIIVDDARMEEPSTWTLKAKKGFTGCMDAVFGARNEQNKADHAKRGE